MKRLMLIIFALMLIGGPLFSFFYFGNTTDVEDNPSRLEGYDPASGLFRVSFFSIKQGKTIVATAPLARVAKLTGKQGECALALLEQKYMNYFSAYLNQDDEFEFMVMDDENNNEISFNDQLIPPVAEWLLSCRP